MRTAPLMAPTLLATARGAQSLANHRSGRSSTSKLPTIEPTIWRMHWQRPWRPRLVGGADFVVGGDHVVVFAGRVFRCAEDEQRLAHAY
jgi:hypothetical protein